MATAAQPGGLGRPFGVRGLTSSRAADGVDLFGPFRPGEYLKRLTITLAGTALDSDAISVSMLDANMAIDEAIVEAAQVRFVTNLAIIIGGSNTMTFPVALEYLVRQDGPRYLAVHHDVTGLDVVTTAVELGSAPCVCDGREGLGADKPLATEIPGQGGTRRRRSTGLDRRQAVRGGPDIVTEVR